MLDQGAGHDRRDADARALDERIARFIASDKPDEDAFEKLALECFAYQYARNEPYRRYCDRFGRTPDDTASWRDIPAVPSASFAAARLASFPPGRTELMFHSSGTTSGGERASTLELESTFLYDASLLRHFRDSVLPDADTMRVIALMPSAREAPHSSLSYMADRIIKDIGARGSGFFIRDAAIVFDDLTAALANTDDPAVVFGTAFAFVHLFDRCRAEGRHFQLPAGSRIIETGGFKGRSREIARHDLYAAFEELLGVPRDMCASEYGMCELGSQWYDANIRDHIAGRPSRRDLKIGPHWARTTIVDPVTATPVPAGEPGLAQIFDLSNRGSVCAVLTSDLGRGRDGGFELSGRFKGAVPKGCSIAADALLQRDHG